jgi:hypothetical protein
MVVAGSGGRDRFVSVLGWPFTFMSEYDTVSAGGEIESGVDGLFSSGVVGNGDGGRPRILLEFRGAKGLGVHVGRVEYSVYLSGLDLSQCDLFLDIIEHH